ncbi:MAG: hypothetical protein Q7N50_08515 [Armatimonadota bacterium]|nr:hypothetical protein [Armatimonadota bacterium]
MKSLIWKEFREKRIWGLALLASVVGPIIFGKSYTFCPSGLDTITPWLSLMMIVSLLFGFSAYSSEISGGAAGFLYSRRISWKKVMLAKIIVGLGTIVLVSILAAVIYYLTCPDIYARFATLDRLAIGIVYSTCILGLPYLIGAICSVVLPGIFGGIIVMLGLTAGLSLYVYLLSIGNPPNATGDSIPFIWFAGPLIAAILTARFGLTLSTRTRTIRYGVIALVMSLCLSYLSIASGLDRKISGDNAREICFLSLSPDGKNAIVQWEKNEDYSLSGVYLVRLSDKSRIRVSGNQINIAQCYWLDSSHCVLQQVQTPSITLISFDADKGRALKISVKVKSVKTSAFTQAILPSPSRRIAAIISNFTKRNDSFTNRYGSDSGINILDAKNSMQDSGAKLQFFDLISGKRVHQSVNGARDIWWQSNTEVTYLDKSNKRHTINMMDSK